MEVTDVCPLGAPGSGWRAKAGQLSFRQIWGEWQNGIYVCQTLWRWGKTGQPVAVMKHIPMHISTSAASVSLHHVLGFLAPFTELTFDGTFKDREYETCCECVE